MPGKKNHESLPPLIAKIHQATHCSPQTHPWSFFINPSHRDQLRIGNVFLALSPERSRNDNRSAKSRTPQSMIEKIGGFSPFDTTIQKRAENSPISPDRWRKIDSSLKKTKRTTFTPFSNLFHHSSEKENIFELGDRFEDPLHRSPGFHTEPLLFPDLDKNIYEILPVDFTNNPQHIITTNQNFSRNLVPFPFDLAEPIEKSKSRELVSETKIIPIKDKTTSEGCNCRNTKCLKLYCDCLRKGKICGENCNCAGCENHTASALRKDRIRYIEKKNPQAFKPIIVESRACDTVKVHNKGCNCRKSNCLKNYCECHQFGVRCTDSCKCSECKNTPWAKPEIVRPRPKKSGEDEKTDGKNGKDFIAQVNRLPGL
jgi:hypothetical protein